MSILNKIKVKKKGTMMVVASVHVSPLDNFGIKFDAEEVKER